MSSSCPSSCPSPCPMSIILTGSLPPSTISPGDSENTFVLLTPPILSSLRLISHLSTALTWSLHKWLLDTNINTINSVCDWSWTTQEGFNSRVWPDSHTVFRSYGRKLTWKNKQNTQLLNFSSLVCKYFNLRFLQQRPKYRFRDHRGFENCWITSGHIWLKHIMNIVSTK